MNPHIVILGAGPAGLGAAYRLAGKAQVTVLEQNNRVGGNAGSFNLAGIWLDYGSHRLHPSCDPIVLNDIQTLLGSDLLDRPRHGRIHLKGRWIHFPLKPLDLAFRLPPSFIAGVSVDSLAKLLPGRLASAGGDNFASVMEKGLGKTICRDFYFPYARKVWGEDPTRLSATQARRRVSAGSIGKMVRRVLSAVPGLRPAGSGRFYYPRQGFGQISAVYFEAAKTTGARFLFQARVKSVGVHPEGKATVALEHDGQYMEIEADQVWSTIPITVFAKLLEPKPPAEILAATGNIDYRSMLLIYLVLETSQFTEYDAHYFPDPRILITRLSEPKNYSASSQPSDRTVLCAELPCSPEDEVWGMTESALAGVVSDALAKAGIPITARIDEVTVHRLRFAYPIYLQGYEKHFEALDDCIRQYKQLLTFGRQGLFAHDNTHHALYMAYCAAECVNPGGSFNWELWQEYRRIFETHVVED